MSASWATGEFRSSPCIKIRATVATTRYFRRDLLKAGAGLVAAAALGDAQTLDRLVRSQADPNRRILLQGGIVLSLDPQVGDFEKADVLIEGKKISAVGPNLAAKLGVTARSALLVNAADRIVMPGFVDTHHHQYETLLRGILADGLLGIGGPPDGSKNYISVIQGIFTPAYLPDDAYIS